MNKVKSLKWLFVLICAAIFISGCESSESGSTETVESYNVYVTLNYQSVALTSNTPMNIYIDGNEIAHHHTAGFSHSYPLTLTAGVHEFYLKNDGVYKTDSLNFVVESNGQEFVFGTKTRMTFGMEVWLESDNVRGSSASDSGNDSGSNDTAVQSSGENYDNASSGSGSEDPYMYGEINTKGEKIVSFSTSYVCNNGEAEIVRSSMGNGWHVTAHNYYYSYGVDWYELYDTDDGDYYGWVDGNYITWYN